MLHGKVQLLTVCSNVLCHASKLAQPPLAAVTVSELNCRITDTTGSETSFDNGFIGQSRRGRDQCALDGATEHHSKGRYPRPQSKHSDDS